MQPLEPTAILPLRNKPITTIITPLSNTPNARKYTPGTGMVHIKTMAKKNSDRGIHLPENLYVQHLSSFLRKNRIDGFRI